MTLTFAAIIAVLLAGLATLGRILLSTTERKGRDSANLEAADQQMAAATDRIRDDAAVRADGPDAARTWLREHNRPDRGA